MRTTEVLTGENTHLRLTVHPTVLRSSLTASAAHGQRPDHPHHVPTGENAASQNGHPPMSSTNDPDLLPWHWGDATPTGPALSDRAQRVRERRRGHARPTWVDVLGLAFVIAFFGFALGWVSNGVLWINHQPAPIVWDGTLPGCVTEDSVNCYWDAENGNGQGRSFIDWDGRTFYAED